jgi:hypothetical protein
MVNFVPTPRRFAQIKPPLIDAARRRQIKMGVRPDATILPTENARLCL